MLLPDWVLAAGLVFWGVAVGIVPLALPLGVLMLAPRWLGRRVAFGAGEYARVLDLCWLLVFGGVMLTYAREPVGSVLRTFAQWLPLVFLPALHAQLWSETGRVPMGSLLPLPWWRRRDHGGVLVDVTGPYLVFCLLSASVAGGGRPWFFWGLMGVTWLGLWVNRARGWGAWMAGVFLVMATAGGWFVAMGLGELQAWFDNRFLTWVTQWRRDESVHRVTRTAIGTTGSVGGSGQVVLTLRNEGGAAVPARLRTAVYTTWADGSWYAPATSFEKMEGGEGEWVFEDRAGADGTVRVEMRMWPTGGLLAVPGGVRAIGDCVAEGMERTPMGTVRATWQGSMLSYRVDYGRESGWEQPPAEEEGREMRPMDRPAIDAVAEELGLAGQPAAVVADRLADHFARHFRYTTELRPSRSTDPRATTPLGRFLLSDREGHCEYFASAAVLLFRSAGVPARYVTGYLVNPLDREGGVYWVRSRHAHAWVRVWMDGRWEDFDPTPPALFESAQQVGGWERFWTRLRYSVVRWWWLGEKRWLRQAYWLVVPLVVLTVWRFRRLRAVAGGGEGSGGEGGGGGGARVWPGMDSEWFVVETMLAGRGWLRGGGEARDAWARRVEAAAGRTGMGDRLVEAMGLHERLRFDPGGLGLEERALLRRRAGQLGEVLGGEGGVRRGGGATTA